MPALSVIPVFGANERRAATAAAPELRRLLLALGCMVAVSVAALVGEPASFVRADPQLALLLRGMAVIKAAIVLSAVAILVWRFGYPVSNRIAVAYVAGASVLAGASMLIWQLSFIPLAALAFHVAAFVVLVAAWRDGGSSLKLFARAHHPSH